MNGFIIELDPLRAIKCVATGGGLVAIADDPSSDHALDVAPRIPSANELSQADADAVALAPLELRAREKSNGRVGRRVELERRSGGGGDLGGVMVPVESGAGPKVRRLIVAATGCPALETR